MSKSLGDDSYLLNTIVIYVKVFYHSAPSNSNSAEASVRALANNNFPPLNLSHQPHLLVHTHTV